MHVCVNSPLFFSLRLPIRLPLRPRLLRVVVVAVASWSWSSFRLGHYGHPRHRHRICCLRSISRRPPPIYFPLPSLQIFCYLNPPTLIFLHSSANSTAHTSVPCSSNLTCRCCSWIPPPTPPPSPVAAISTFSYIFSAASLFHSYRYINRIMAATKYSEFKQSPSSSEAAWGEEHMRPSRFFSFY